MLTLKNSHYTIVISIVLYAFRGHFKDLSQTHSLCGSQQNIQR